MFLRSCRLEVLLHPFERRRRFVEDGDDVPLDHDRAGHRAPGEPLCVVAPVAQLRLVLHFFSDGGETDRKVPRIGA